MANVIQFFHDKKILLRCWMLFVFVAIVVVGTTTPFHAAYALPGVDILGSLTDFVAQHLGSAIITAISTIFVLINVILSVFEIVTGIVMSTVIHWIQVVPYTPIHQAFIANSTNPITTGWGIMRDLADMGLIFVLIAIAIATILNISFDKEWGKTIISFVAIAILINFSPLITGIIIDISNILTKIFFQNAGDGWRVFSGSATLGTGSAGDLLGQLGSAFKDGNITTALSLLIASIVNIALTLTVIAAFVTMTFLLTARVLALWILVILSPLAFLMYILPSTKQHFEKWWHNFFQWAMLPIPLGLSYYLSATMVQGLSGGGTSGGVLCQGFNGNITSQASFVGGSFTDLIQKVSIFNNFCAPMVLVMAVAFLFVGFFISFSFSAVGSNMIVAQGTKWGSRIGAGAARLASTKVAAPLAAAGGRQIQRGAGLVGRGAGAGAKGVGRGTAALQRWGRVAAVGGKGLGGMTPCPPGYHYDYTQFKCVPDNMGAALKVGATKLAGRGVLAAGKGVATVGKAAGAAGVAAQAVGGKIPNPIKDAAGAAVDEAKKALGPTVVGKAVSAIKQATPETALRAAGALPATLLDIPPDKIQGWLNNMKKPMSMGEAFKQGVGPGIFSGSGQASPQFNPTAFQNAYGTAAGLPGGWNMANPEVINALRNIGSQTFEEQMSRMYLLVQNGLGLILNEQRLQDKKLAEDRKKLYGNIALQDPNAFKQLAKKVPEVLKITADITLKDTLKLTDQDIKNAGGVGNAAQIALIKTMRASDFDGPGGIPQDVLEMSIDKIAYYLPDNQRANILKAIKANTANYTPKFATNFESKMSHKKI